MTTNVVNQIPYLRTTREFPENIQKLCVQVNKSYIDIANAVNNRTISIFPTTRPAITGESWFINQNQRQQTLRQIYSFGAIAAGAELDIPTGNRINTTTGIPIDITAFTRIYGTVITTTGSNGQPDYRPLPYVDPNSLTTSMAILVGNVVISGVVTQCIRIVLGPTAVPVTSGIAVIEWLSPV
jgi:hypothetical protein